MVFMRLDNSSLKQKELQKFYFRSSINFLLSLQAWENVNASISR